MDTISEARSRWLDGDARAWAEYVACCLRLEAEHRQNHPAGRVSEPRAEAARAPARQARPEA